MASAVGNNYEVSQLFVSPRSAWISALHVHRNANVFVRNPKYQFPNLTSRSCRNGVGTEPLQMPGARCSSSPLQPLGQPLCRSILRVLNHGVSLKQETATGPQPNRSWVQMNLRGAAACLLALFVSCSFLTRAAHAFAENSIAASHLGLKIAGLLRESGWPDDLVVFTVAMLPVLELRGAIPISYWLKLDPIRGFCLSVLGNLLPVPFIVLYLERICNFIGDRNNTAKRILIWLLDKTRKKSAVIEEFKWLGLMLFVAVPFPGTGAWTGAVIASILGMPLWSAVTANFLGVVLAGLLVNVVVTVGATYAIIVGAVLFAISTFMWTLLRMVKEKQNKTT